jgi:hypothetical protein
MVALLRYVVLSSLCVPMTFEHSMLPALANLHTVTSQSYSTPILIFYRPLQELPNDAPFAQDNQCALLTGNC